MTARLPRATTHTTADVLHSAERPLRPTPVTCTARGLARFAMWTRTAGPLHTTTTRTSGAGAGAGGPTTPTWGVPGGILAAHTKSTDPLPLCSTPAARPRASRRRGRHARWCLQDPRGGGPRAAPRAVCGSGGSLGVMGAPHTDISQPEDPWGHPGAYTAAFSPPRGDFSGNPTARHPNELKKTK